MGLICLLKGINIHKESNIVSPFPDYKWLIMIIVILCIVNDLFFTASCCCTVNQRPLRSFLTASCRCTVNQRSPYMTASDRAPPLPLTHILLYFMIFFDRQLPLPGQSKVATKKNNPCLPWESIMAEFLSYFFKFNRLLPV